MTEREIWAVAHHVLQGRGETDGRIFICARIGELALRSDAAGVAAWTRIARCFDAMTARQDDQAQVPH